MTAGVIAMAASFGVSYVTAALQVVAALAASFGMSYVIATFPATWIPALSGGCFFRRLTGLYCPGCGGTRAFYAMVYGRPLRSFYYHPIVCYMILAAFCGLILYFTRKAAPQRIVVSILLGAVIVLLMNYDVKNMLLLVGVPLL